MSIVKDIVELHKGTIEVQSELKSGSEFRVIFLKGNSHLKSLDKVEIIDNTDNESFKTIKNKIDKNRENILVVEDNAELQDVLNTSLSNKNYNVLIAKNGKVGYNLAIKMLPQLIITDIMMPEMNGMTLIQKLKSNEKTSLIPVIILTSKTLGEDIVKGYQIGADDYILKPFDVDVLLSRVKNLLKSRKDLKSKYLEISKKNKSDITSKDQLFLEQLYKIIDKNIETNNLKAVQIAKEMNMSHSSLYKKIKELTGLTYVEFIRDYRLILAKQLLENMGYSVTEASYKVGYSDPKYFSKLFKTKFKKNPSKLLKS